ncbi:hypothetical protein [Cohnella nanjingensis]|uniref:Polysaccharide pyruvyl transferase domain-containing protein n=1 Tax=Cohnella nanjingensis TaxID=1387779 RepID=A0A7X0RNA4_9BACL|nr:hypothetical protein [Cohnella nanjingensis]MBB6670622.1 hypothetical protein [Cohnella nanjingensis]
MYDNIYLYADSRSIEQLNTAEEKVLLFGSYIGYSNFGDILQLKGALEFHRSHTDLIPVVVCALESISSYSFFAKLRKWFGDITFIFFDYNLQSDPSFMLQQIHTSTGVHHLHLYGGGYLNTMWGEFKLSIVEFLLKTFKIEHYVITGQQLDKNFISNLSQHIQTYSPSLIGGRDYESANLIKMAGWKGGYSFDDASDIIQSMKNNLKFQINDQIMFHVNTSSYTHEKLEHAINTISNSLKRIKAYNNKLQLLQMYSDKRYVVRDTLETIIDLEDEFPFDTYVVQNLAIMALEYQTIQNDDLLQLGNLGVTSSYHTTMFLNMLGIPCHLFSFNDYYDQKRGALDNKGTLDEFLNAPYVPDYEAKLKERQDWIYILKSDFLAHRNEKLKIEKINYIITSTNLAFSYKDDQIQKNLNTSLQWQREQTNIWWEKYQRSIQELQWQKEQTDSWWNKHQQITQELEWQKEQTDSWWNKHQVLISKLDQNQAIFDELKDELINHQADLLKSTVELEQVHREYSQCREYSENLEKQLEHLNSWINYIKYKIKKRMDT